MTCAATRAATPRCGPPGGSASSPDGRAVAERDEVLEAVVRDELRDLGMCEYEIDDALGTMRDQGMFDVPDWTP